MIITLRDLDTRGIDLGSIGDNELFYNHTYDNRGGAYSAIRTRLILLPLNLVLRTGNFSVAPFLWLYSKYGELIHTFAYPETPSSSLLENDIAAFMRPQLIKVTYASYDMVYRSITAHGIYIDLNESRLVFARYSKALEGLIKIDDKCTEYH